MSELEFSSTDYMKGCEPVTATCVKDGIPMLNFYKGNQIDGFGCGHCGLSISIQNKRYWDLPKNEVQA